MVVAGAVAIVPGAEYAGVTLLRDGSYHSYTSCDELAREVDRSQAHYREGPSVTAMRDGCTVVVDDMAAETSRWPRFAPHAVSHGVLSMLSFRLFSRGETVGALSLYAGEAHGFTEQARAVGARFAPHAATALGEVQHVARMHRAVDNRDLIGQAKGMLMERFDVGPERAFAMLVESSQQTNLKLVDVARWLVGEGETHAHEGNGSRRSTRTTKPAASRGRP